MTTLMQVSRQWSERPDDERFVSLIELRDAVTQQRKQSKDIVVRIDKLRAAPTSSGKEVDGGIAIVGPDGNPAAPTNWAFGQLAQHASAPASYLRGLPAPLAADCINWGLTRHDKRGVEAGVLLRKNGTTQLAAVTGPRYGRVWNSAIAEALVKRFGDGLTGDFRVPGEFGKEVGVTKSNTTLYAGDRDMFVFLADERNRIEIPNRRNGAKGTLARGFFVWNSEVGAQTFGVATFLFDYVCANRIVWGAEEVKELRIRHTSGAPERWFGEIVPALRRYAETSTGSVIEAVEQARGVKLLKRGDDAAVRDFLASRFTRQQATAIEAAHLQDEGRPIETLWDAVVGATAFARGIPHQDERVRVERIAGQMMAA